MNLNPEAMLKAAGNASELLKSMSNRHRLLILCQLIESEKSVGQLSAFLGIRSSTVSQHLALMREEKLVTTRRDGQTIWYQIESQPARRIIEVLYQTFCNEAEI